MWVRFSPKNIKQFICLLQSRMNKIMKLIQQPLPEHSNTGSSVIESTQQQSEVLILDSFLHTQSNNNFDLESILPDTISPSFLDFECETHLNLDHVTNEHDSISPLSKFLVDYSDSDSNNSYTLMDLDNQSKISKIDNDRTTIIRDPMLSTFVSSHNINNIQPSTRSEFEQPEQNLSMQSHDTDPYTDSEDSWKPEASSNDSDQDSPQQVEEETSVGKRAYRKIKPLPKRLLLKKNRQAAVGKSMQPNPCLNKKCGNSCGDKFSEDDRIVIFENYWGLGNAKRQKDFLLSCATAKKISRKRSTSNMRKTSYDYTINYNGQNIKICQQFLLKTLNISQMSLRYTIENANKILNTTRDDRRNLLPHNKSDPAKVSYLKSFIEMLPAVPSHYCRNKSTKVYLPQEFQNLSYLYKLYVDYLKEKQLETLILSKRVFRYIFKTEFNIGFHLPKKDKCVFCEKCKNLSPESRTVFEQTIEYKNHMQDKEKCKQLFLDDQKMSKVTNSASLCVSFDLEKVLNTPHGKSVTLYYSRKYAFYNESIYESGTRAGYCYVWGECQGKRGCNEIVTVLFKYLNMLDQRGTKTVINLYADSCAGQNRNRAMIAMIIKFLKTTTTISEIKVTYLLPGHTMMPVDSIHSTIESFVRNKTVWAPSEWPTMITNARSDPTGYIVYVLNHGDFMDWKSFSQALLPAKFKINFNSLRVVHFHKNNPVVTFRYGFFEDSDKHDINIDLIIRSRANTAIVEKGPLSLYHEELKIASSKYKDLQDLCNKNVIPNRYHQEYLNMKHDGAVRDVLPETDEEDSDKQD